ncbi:MAG: hypothetical protein JJ864_08730 [Rhizobiaceae bacterium]|nr:hypothetical protein [Rhizobiaceae bacterium]
MDDRAELIERLGVRLGGHHSSVTVEEAALVKFFDNAGHFFNHNIVIKARYAVLPPVEKEYLAFLYDHPFLLHGGCSRLSWQPSIKYIQFISASKKLISEKLKPLITLLESLDGGKDG